MKREAVYSWDAGGTRWRYNSRPSGAVGDCSVLRERGSGMSDRRIRAPRVAAFASRWSARCSCAACGPVSRPRGARRTGRSRSARPAKRCCGRVVLVHGDQGHDRQDGQCGGGTCSAPFAAAAGSWVILEDISGGIWNQVGASVQPASALLAENDKIGKIKVTVAAGQETQVTIINAQAAATLKVCKYSSSPALQGASTASRSARPR